MIRTYGLTHVALAATDPRRSAQFYQVVFGCEVVFDSGDFVQLQTPGARDVIVLERAPEMAGVRGGVAHIGFRLHSPADIDAAAAAVRAAGGTIAAR